MANNYGTDPEKMLDWNKKLGEQSEFIKKAIDPLLSWELAYHITISDNNYNGDKEYEKLSWIQQYKAEQDVVKKYILKNGDVSNLFDMLSYDNIFVGDEKPVVEKLKSLGIEGCRHHDRVDVYNDEYLKELNIVHEQHYKYNWENVSLIPTMDEFLGDYLETNLGQENKNLSSYFIVGFPIDQKSDSNNTIIMFFQNGSDIEDNKPTFSLNSSLDFNTVKKMVENTVECISNLIPFHPEGLTIDDIKNNLDEQIYKEQQLEKLEKHFDEWPETSQTSDILDEQPAVSDHKYETAQKIGYVQGVCESVLAFNTDENRKIMSEATITFLSKKLLSEMNVTKDMAQKFANPETYKALEQCVFAPKQEQQLEQTQSQKRGW